MIITPFIVLGIMQRYKGFGFYIDSDWTLPMIQSLTSQPAVDLTIQRGAVSSSGLEDEYHVSPYLHIAPEEIWLTVDHIARFCIQNDHIIVDPLTDDAQTLETFIAYAAMPFWLCLQNCIVLRGAAVSFDQKTAQLILSHSGVGSSTIAGLATQGDARLVSDHLVILRRNDAGQFLLYPGYIQLKLWKDALKKLSLKMDRAIPLRESLEVYQYPANYIEAPLTIASICLIKTSNHPKETMPVKGFKKMSAYLNYCTPFSNYHSLKARKDRPSIWLDLVKQTSIYTTYLHNKVETPQALYDRLCKDVWQMDGVS